MSKESSPIFTNEQNTIIQSTGDIAINAVAGSGKTTTLIQYAAKQPSSSRILYIAFNKSVKLDAARKFAEHQLHNVRVETAHSLAFNYIVKGSNYKVKAQSFKTHEITELLNLNGDGEKHGEYVVANHINKFIAYFCNSDKARVQDLNYLDTVTDEKANQFVKRFYTYIEKGTRVLLSKMDKAEIEIIHDFYLKKFQLANIQLPYDCILFDEGQDASPAMLHVFMQQQCVKVIVGDTHQQIYGWRYAVNSLEKVKCKKLSLSTSFRFPQSIANLACSVLYWKNQLTATKPLSIKGQGLTNTIKTKAIIARTNLGLLLKAIEFVTKQPKINHLYFEGNINSYTYADDGASLYDVLSLYNNKKTGIRDKLIAQMKDIDELEEYIEKTEDIQLGMMLSIVNEYGNRIPSLLNTLKEKHTGDGDRSKAQMIFSTVHRAKGMEYDEVELAEDFISEGKLIKQKIAQQSKQEPLNITKLNEEINLLYVALTRAKFKLKIPEQMLPQETPASVHIHILKQVKEENSGPIQKNSAPKSYTVADKRLVSKAAYQPWTPELDDKLRILFDMQSDIADIAKEMGRTKTAIESRLKRLNYFTA